MIFQVCKTKIQLSQLLPLETFLFYLFQFYSSAVSLRSALIEAPKSEKTLYTQGYQIDISLSEVVKELRIKICIMNAIMS